jgi:hypothetical protein
MNIFFWKKSALPGTSAQDATPKGYVKYEEIDAKKTSKLGYFFLILMVIFGVWQGNALLDAIKTTIPVPVANSQCFYDFSGYSSKFSPTSENYVDGYYNPTKRYTYYENSNYGYNYQDQTDASASVCSFSERETTFGFPDVYGGISTSIHEYTILRREKSKIENDLYQIKSLRAETLDEYSVSLLEKIAKENNVISGDTLKDRLQASGELLEALTVKQKNLAAQLDSKMNEIASYVNRYDGLMSQIDDAYVKDIRIYRFAQYGLGLLLILPLFLFVIRKYFKLKNNNSEFAVIWGGVVALMALLLAQILFEFVYQIIPHRLIQKIFEFLSNFEFIFVIVYWLGFILIPAFFGYLIYIIQKKYYNRRAVVMRAFKANKCPTCTMSVAPHMVFCPACGTNLKVKCSHCGQNSPNAGDFCELCGEHKDTQ